MGIFHGAMLMIVSVGVSVILPSCASAKGPNYADENAFCNGRAKAECNDQVIAACAVADATHCIASRQQACVAAIPTGTTFNSGAADGCVSAVASAYGDAKVTADENQSVIDACKLVFDGPGIDNSACTMDLDCKVSMGLRCVRTGGLATGTCQVAQSVPGGGSCAASNQQCADGYHCGASLHCDIDSQQNEACSAAMPCVSTTLCTNSTCMVKADDGIACTGDEQCLHGICARGVSDAQGLCASQLTLAPNEPFCRDAR